MTIADAIIGIGRGVQFVGAAIEWSGQEVYPGCGVSNGMNVIRKGLNSVYEKTVEITDTKPKCFTKDDALALAKIMNGEA